MSFQDLQDVILDAIEVVLDWDIPDEALGDAVNAQACLMARAELD